uniref:hypothetical protein n=1 Tax=Runella sp. TaxID=1960881 RepID=UPI00263A1E85
MLIYLFKDLVFFGGSEKYPLVASVGFGGTVEGFVADKFVARFVVEVLDKIGSVGKFLEFKTCIGLFRKKSNANVGIGIVKDPIGSK